MTSDLMTTSLSCPAAPAHAGDLQTRHVCVDAQGHTWIMRCARGDEYALLLAVRDRAMAPSSTLDTRTAALAGRSLVALVEDNPPKPSPKTTDR